MSYGEDLLLEVCEDIVQLPSCLMVRCRQHIAYCEGDDGASDPVLSVVLTIVLALARDLDKLR